MIQFSTLRYRNFLSTGNTFTEIQLDRHQSTLIVGHNGSGKSTMLDALSFALFGKPHRGINKAGLVNSINNKKCEVEVKFKIGSNRYEVKRGIKPNIFEIYHNDVLMNQESHSRDYQKILENNILKLNHKSFHQIVVLGSSNFIPFMQLAPGARREVIEDLLDIGIFTDMNKLLKERASEVKSNITDVVNQLNIVSEQITLEETHIDKLRNIDRQQTLNSSKKLEDLSDQITLLELRNIDLINEHKNKFPALDEGIKSSEQKNTKLIQCRHGITSKLSSIDEHEDFFRNNDHCPTCSQTIDINVKDEKQGTYSKERDKLDKGLVELDEELTSLKTDLDRKKASLVQIEHLQHDYNSNMKIIGTLSSQISSIKHNEAEEKIDLTEAEKSLTDKKESKLTLGDERFTHMEERSYQDIISELLKDTGIKTKIIRQYLPVMNKFINQYLGILDFFVKFELDEKFEETIKSRHRDVFRYNSFSEGEKSRIDLSLLFSWRQIAKMKNSTNTNLLLLDETFDSSLDADGLDNLMKILGTLTKDTNVFIISHKKDVLDGKFDNKIEFQKINNFSAIK